jgi:hypothetical protein
MLSVQVKTAWLQPLGQRRYIITLNIVFGYFEMLINFNTQSKVNPRSYFRNFLEYFALVEPRRNLNQLRVTHRDNHYLAERYNAVFNSSVIEISEEADVSMDSVRQGDLPAPGSFRLKKHSTAIFEDRQNDVAFRSGGVCTKQLTFFGAQAIQLNNQLINQE